MEPTKSLTALLKALGQPALRGKNQPAPWCPINFSEINSAFTCYLYCLVGWISIMGFGAMAMRGALGLSDAGAGRAFLCSILCGLTHGGVVHFFFRRTQMAWMSQARIELWEQRCQDYPNLREHIEQWLIVPRTLREQDMAGVCFHEWRQEENHRMTRETKMREEQEAIGAWQKSSFGQRAFVKEEQQTLALNLGDGVETCPRKRL